MTERHIYVTKQVEKVFLFSYIIQGMPFSYPYEDGLGAFKITSMTLWSS